MAEEQLPLQRRDRPGLAPGSLTVLRDWGRAYHRTVRGPFVRNWLPVLVWAAVIFSFSSIPDLGTGLGTWDLVLRKLAHTAEYAILGALLVRATGRAGLALAIGILYAVSDEVHQLFHLLNRQLGITLVIATHNESLTRSMGRALRMREGHLIEERG